MTAGAADTPPPRAMKHFPRPHPVKDAQPRAWIASLLGGVFLSAWCGSSRADVPEPCSPAKVAQVIAPASLPGTSASYKSERQFIDCQLVLNSTTTVTLPLVLEGHAASNVTIDCKGGTLDGRHYPEGSKYRVIEVRSKKTKNPVQGQDFGQWEPPINVTVKNCTVMGSIRLVGMSENATGDAILWSSRAAGHVERVRQAAPSRITFQNVTLHARGGNAIYFSAGVNHSRIVNSTITGNLRAGAIYMDAESHHNMVRGNHFKRDIPVGAEGYPDGDRELISLDGASHNLIASNVFDGLSKGGVFLYRNCGESSVIRHATPSHNVIVNNVFLYASTPPNVFDAKKPAVHVGSRDGKDWSQNWDCSDDAGYPFGSSSSDQDFASHNAVVQNQVTWHPTADTLRVGNTFNENNYFHANNGYLKKADALALQSAHAGCFVAKGVAEKFILDGASVSQVMAVSAAEVAQGSFNNPKATTLHATRLLCDDGVLRPRLTPSGLALVF